MLTIDMGTLECTNKPDSDYCSVDMAGNVKCQPSQPSATYWQEQARLALIHADLLRSALVRTHVCLAAGDFTRARERVEDALEADARATAEAAKGAVQP